MAQPGVTYLVVQEGLNAIKVGVTAVGSNRLSVFQRHGWAIVGKVPFESGFEAFSAEQDILRWWRDDLQLPPYLTAENMPIGGWSETAELESVPINIAVARLHAVAERIRSTASTVSEAKVGTSFAQAGEAAIGAGQKGPVRHHITKPAAGFDGGGAALVAAAPLPPEDIAEDYSYGQLRLF